MAWSIISLREWMAFAQSYRGVIALMAAAHTNPDSALYASCAAVHSASARLLLASAYLATACAEDATLEQQTATSSFKVLGADITTARALCQAPS